MLRLTIKILLFGFIVWGLNNLFYRCLKLPPLWAISYDKEVYFDKHRDQINTLFLGSSLTYRQVNTKQFDSVNKANQIETSSFNFGMDGSCPVEVYSVYKQILSQPNSALKNVFVELDFIDNFDSIQLHSIRRKSYFGLAQYKHTLPLTIGSNYSLEKKKQFLTFDFSHVFESEFKLGMLEEVYKFKTAKKEMDKAVTVDDYLPLNSNDTSTKVFMKRKFKNPHLRFLDENQPEFKQNIETAEKIFADTSFLKDARVDKEYICMVQEMLGLAAKKNVRLIFVLPPRLSAENYKDLLPVYFSLPQKNRIQLADGNQYPEFYDLQNSYDLKHLDQKGSVIYTGKLSEQFLKLEKSN